MININISNSYKSTVIKKEKKNQNTIKNVEIVNIN